MKEATGLRLISKFTILIESFVLVLEGFLVLLLELDSFGNFLRIENWLDRSFILKVRHVVTMRKQMQKLAWVTHIQTLCQFNLKCLPLPLAF